MKYEELMIKAKEAAKNAYSPYSKFSVGACVLADSGKMYSGCNFENSSFGLTICAERNAIGNAITNGERKILAIAIFSPDMDDCSPCGACRQVLNEFKIDDMDIVTNASEGLKIRTLNELLPQSFSI